MGPPVRLRRRVTGKVRPDPGHRPGAHRGVDRHQGAKRTRQVNDAEIGVCLRFTTLEVARGGREQLTSVS